MGWLEAGRTVRGTSTEEVTCDRKTFGRPRTNICCLEGELYLSDKLEDSRRTDEESELSSIPSHTTLGGWHCQPQAPFHKPTDCSDRSSINKRHHNRTT